jgi:hypothetical protein
LFAQQARKVKPHRALDHIYARVSPSLGSVANSPVNFINVRVANIVYQVFEYHSRTALSTISTRCSVSRAQSMHSPRQNPTAW